MKKRMMALLIACVGANAFAQIVAGSTEVDAYRFHALTLKDNPQLTEGMCNRMLSTLDSIYRNDALLAFYSVDWARINSIYNGTENLDTLRPARDQWFLTNRNVTETSYLNSEGGDSVQVLEDGTEVYVFTLETYDRIQTVQLKEIRVREKAVWNARKKRYDYIPDAFSPVWCFLNYDAETLSELPETTTVWIPFKQLETIQADWLMLLKKREWKGIQYRQEPIVEGLGQPVR